MISDKPRVVVGLSGGLDSSMAIFLLKKQGYQPIGVSLKFSVWADKKNLCLPAQAGCTNESFNLARKLCQKLGVPYHLIDCQKEFERIVINYFVRELKAGHTPNPCVVCNQKLKFPKLFQLARKLGAKYVATGHYARLRREIRNSKSEIRNNVQSTNLKLLTARDKTKDQTYFLYTLKQNQLAKLIFPLGKMTKEEARKIATQEKILYTKKESQDFCFVANQSLVEFLKTKIGQKPGPIYDPHHKLLGTHQGLHFYTIGQRKGLSFGKKYWVCAVDKKRNALIVTNDERNLFKKELIIKKVNWIANKRPHLPLKIMAKVRYRQKTTSGIINYNQKFKVYRLTFRVSQRAITPGQSCVFYLPAQAGQDKVCLGGGIIESLTQEVQFLDQKDTVETLAFK